MGDRIAAATYSCAVGAAGGELRLTGVDPADLAAVCCCLEEAGCRLHTDGEGLSIAASGRMRGIRTVRTAPYPGFPTDAQAIPDGGLGRGTGTTMIVENMFDSRYRHVDELARMGADIQLAGRVAVVTGSRLHGAAVRSTDLRGGAALVGGRPGCGRGQPRKRLEPHPPGLSGAGRQPFRPWVRTSGPGCDHL